jgi:alpha-D-ribose 1-methylphosphonate 5-triphosphate synthase subunit PhnL
MLLIEEARHAGSAVVAVFHDEAERSRACSRAVSL